jgi:hypothetical protein
MHRFFFSPSALFFFSLFFFFVQLTMLMIELEHAGHGSVKPWASCLIVHVLSEMQLIGRMSGSQKDVICVDDCMGVASVHLCVTHLRVCMRPCVFVWCVCVCVRATLMCVCLCACKRSCVCLRASTHVGLRATAHVCFWVGVCVWGLVCLSHEMTAYSCAWHKYVASWRRKNIIIY